MNLNFTQDGTRYICELTPTEPCIVQVELEQKKDFTVYEYISGMKPVSVFSTSILDNIIFKVEVPSGVIVRMVSQSPVIKAKMI